MAPESKKKKKKDASEPKGKTLIKIPLPIVPSDEKSLDEEMTDLFDEDRVTHRHGGSEPERD